MNRKVGMEIYAKGSSAVKETLVSLAVVSVLVCVGSLALVPGVYATTCGRVTAQLGEHVRSDGEVYPGFFMSEWEKEACSRV